MEQGFLPIPSAEGWQLSNAPVLSMAAHKAALDVFEEAGWENVFAKNKMLNQICYVPFSGWPPGFTFWILPFTILNNNFHTVSVIADCFFMLILFVGVYKLLRSLFNERAKEYFSIFCLLNMISFSPIYYFTSTDRYAVTFFIFALYFFVQLIQNKNNNRLNSLLTALFIFLAALTRFAYRPMTSK